MSLRALIFDVDGTLADTERDGHRPAFNAAFAEAGLDWSWDEGTYGELLQVAGGLERMLHYARRVGHGELDESTLLTQLRRVHAAKTAHYVAHVAAGHVRLRPGIERLIREARSDGIALAIATTTTRENVLALLDATLGPGSESWFSAIGTAAEVERKKPDPAVYRWALEQLRLPASDALAFEDTRNGLLAARGAGIRCIVTPTPYSEHEDFAEALLVVTDLEHHPGQRDRAIVLADLRRWANEGID
jgi:beta-phosphoglucomutase-like phosphatase (HAD superfamily)